MPRTTGPEIIELFYRVAAGDEDAFTSLFYHYTPQIFPFVRQKVRDEAQAEEIVQDIFLRLWVYRDRLATLEAPQDYLFRIAANRVKDHFRDMALRVRMQQRLATEGALEADPTEAMDLGEARRTLAEGVETLPVQRRRVFELRQQGLSYEEIGRELGVSPNTVRNHVVEANRYLLEFLRTRGLGVLLLILTWRR